MAIENVQQLLTEQLGKNAGTEVFTGAVSGKNFYCVYFPVESVVSAITAASVTNVTALQTTLPAGTTLFMNITAITLTSGIAIGYKE
jgi:hypothetical protein|tara:strand:- start:457 stop:717 length:261 start_codon:yes stop_codon:yes gene_type:complete